jgi:transposase-like protein
MSHISGGESIAEDAIPHDSPEFPTLADRLNKTADSSALTERQKAAIELLLMGKTMTATARALEIDRKTLYNWRSDDRFREVLEERRRELWSDASGRLVALVHPSLDVLEQHLADRYDRARFRAASTVLKLARLRVGPDALG